MPQIEIPTEGIAEDMKALEPLGDAPIATAPAIAALALNLAMKYHDISTIKDGALYQQYKLEGRNIIHIHLDHVFETAIQIEKHLLTANERIAKIVIDAIETRIDESEATDGAPADGELAGPVVSVPERDRS